MRNLHRIFLSTLLTGILASAQAQTTPVADSTLPKTYTYIERMPVFPGRELADSSRNSGQRFMHFLNEGLTFPPRALRDGVTGRVYFSFTVDSHGRTTNIKLVKGLRDDIDAAILRHAHRLDAIQWKPGTQNDRPVSVSFTVPISLNIQHAPGKRGLSTDSLNAPAYNKAVVLPLNSWDTDRHILPSDQGIVYGSCVQRLGFNSGGLGQYVRLANLTTGKAVRIAVKPAMRSRKESAFCFALPPGRYALYKYEFSISRWYGPELHEEQLLKPVLNLDLAAGPALSVTRFLFTVEAGSVSCVGAWDFSQENAPVFSADKARLDAELQPHFKNLSLRNALLRVPH